jgi:nucleoside-diphosphate-sugar epimerase
LLDRRKRLDLVVFRAVNRDATARIGRAAAEEGVSCFVYLSAIGEQLGWPPPVGLEAGLRETVRWYGAR